MSTLKRCVGRTFLALLTVTFVLPATVRAAEEVRKPSQPHIVLIGISEYADKQIKARPRAEADAKALYDLFTSKDYLGVKPENVRLLLGKPDEKRNSSPATRKNILDAVRWLSTDAKRDDLVIFAFFGQGCSLGERGDRTCYFAADSTVEGRDKDAVASADIAQDFDKLKSQQVCVLLDHNFKGFDAGKKSLPEPTLGENPYKEFLGDDEGEDHMPLPGRVIYLATNGLTPSIDLEEHGLFATALLSGLKGEADSEGYEADGLVTVDELTKYLGKQIPELKRKLMKTEETRKAEHFIIGGSRGTHYVLTNNPKSIGKANDRLKKLDTVATKLGSEMTMEARRVLERMPRLEGLRSLRKEYQNYLDGELTLDQLKEKRETVLASMKLTGADARAFASKVLRGIQVIDDEYVKEINKGEMAGWAIRGLYRWLDEQIPEEIAEKLDSKKIKELDSTQLGAILMEARAKLGKREDLDNHKDIDIALQRALGRLDPYTTFIDAETVKKFDQDVKGRFDGIGVQIRKDQATDMLQVVTPIKNSPSYKIGLQEGDLIVEIIREVDSYGKELDKPEIIQTKDVTLTDAVKKILGKAGTKVKLKIKREGKDQPFEVEITRNSIELESVFGVKRNADDSWDYWLDKEAKIGYARMTSFMPTTSRELTRVVRELRQAGMRGFVLDLRFNPGGLLDSARDIGDLFIDEGPIVSIRRPRLGQEHRMDGRSPGSELGFNMVCLVNGYSASASEIVSACLQDHSRAVIMGERSYGKGSVQNIQEFDGGKIKVTIASFWRPNGKNLNKSSTGGKEDEDWGVRPDKGYLIELSRKERDDLAEHLRNTEIIARKEGPAKKPEAEFKDRQLDTAIKYLREKQRASR